MRAPTDRDRLDRFLHTLGQDQRRALRLYLVGGAAVVDLGLRATTLDIDYVVQAEDPAAVAEFERQLPRLKEQLDINAEPASPGDFLPVPAGVLDRAPYQRSYGHVAVYHYPYAFQVLAKIARFAERDLADIELLLRHQIVQWSDVEAAWDAVQRSDTGWLRHTPAEVARRVQIIRDRLQAAGLI